jgi:MFS family permease
LSESEGSPGGELRGVTIAGLLLASAQAPLGSTMIAVALPSISHALGSDIGVTTSLLVTSYLIVNIVGQSPGGKLGDVLGHALTVRVGMLLYAAGALAGLLAERLGLLVVSRATMALGGALVVPATMALLRVHVPAERRGRVFGMVGATMGLSAAIGPPLGGEIVTRFGWRGIFAASLPFLLVAALLVRHSPLPRDPKARRTTFPEFARRFDWAGSGLFATGLAALVVGSKLAGSARLGTLAGSLTVMVTFVLWELRSKDPVLDVRLFKNRGFFAGSSGVALQNFAMYGLIFQLPQFFTVVRHATAKEVGHVLFVMMLAMFVTSPLGGRLADRFGSRTAALAGALPLLGGLVLLSRIGTFQTPSDAAPALIVLGIGIGLSGAPLQAAAMASVSAKEAGMAAGATSTMRYVGGVLSILFLSAILGAGRAGIIAAHEAAIRMFTVGAVVATLTCFLLPGKGREAA